MKTLTLKNVVLEINNVNLTKQTLGTTGLATPGLPGTDTTTKPLEQHVLNLSGSLKIGGVQITFINKTYVLTDAELSSTSLGSIEDLGVTKISAEFGI